VPRPNIKHFIAKENTNLNDSFIPWSEIAPYFVFEKPRKIQEVLLRVIISAIEKGRKEIVLSAPTGIGKSVIAVTIAKWIEAQGKKSLFHIPRKALVDQYQEVFPEYPLIKGNNEYRCILSHNELKKAGFEPGYYTKDKAPCSVTKYFCKYKPRRRGEKDGLLPALATSAKRGEMVCGNDPCPFWEEKIKCLNSKIIFASSMFAYMERQTSDDFGVVEFGVYDEGDHVETDIMSVETVKITEKELEEFMGHPMQIPNNIKDIKEWIPVVEKLREGALARGIYLSGKIKDMEIGTKNKGLILREKMRLRFSEERLEKYDDIISYIKKWPDTMVSAIGEDEIKGEKVGYVEFKPAFVRQFAGKHLRRSSTRLFMSATILHPVLFGHNIGMYDFLYIEVPESPFPTKNRGIELHNVGRVNNNTIRELMPKIMAEIKQIVADNQGRSGLIIPVSHRMRLEIYRALMKDISFSKIQENGVECPYCGQRLWQLFPHVEDIHKTNTYQFLREFGRDIELFSPAASIITNGSHTLERKKAMALFSQGLICPECGDYVHGGGSVLHCRRCRIHYKKSMLKPMPRLWISTYPKEGFDGKDDVVRYIIIPKMFYAYLGDPLVQKRKEVQPTSYLIDALRSLIQASGRGTRHEDDYCNTHVLDSGINTLLGMIRRSEGKLRNDYLPNASIIPRWWEKAMTKKK